MKSLGTKVEVRELIKKLKKSIDVFSIQETKIKPLIAPSIAQYYESERSSHDNDNPNSLDSI